MTVPDFGKPWAARGETRPLRFRTPVAWIDGFDGGVLLVQSGDDRPEHVRLVMMSHWLAWVKAEDACPVPELYEDDPLADVEQP